MDDNFFDTICRNGGFCTYRSFVCLLRKEMEKEKVIVMIFIWGKCWAHDTSELRDVNHYFEEIGGHLGLANYEVILSDEGSFALKWFWLAAVSRKFVTNWIISLKRQCQENTMSGLDIDWKTRGRFQRCTNEILFLYKQTFKK